MFDQAVVVLLRVDYETDTAQGLVLNKRGTDSLAQLMQSVQKDQVSSAVLGPDWLGMSLDKGVLQALGPTSDHLVFQGGPIVDESLDNSLLWLHTHGRIVPDAWEIAPSIFLSGDIGTTAALERARREQGGAGGLRFFRGFAAWSLSQLEIEMERGVWIRARADCPSAAFELCLGSAEPVSAWRGALEAVGLPALARFPRGPNVDSMLTAVVEEHQQARAEELMAAGRG